MSKVNRVFKLIEEDWEIYPYKKMKKLYDFDASIKILGSGGYLSLIIIALSGLCQSFTYQFFFRLASLNGFIGFIAKLKHRHLSRKYGVYIPRDTSIGGGLIIWHCVGIVINPKAKIGENCDIFQFVSIGEKNNGNATIGNNVFIGPNLST